MKGIVSYGVEQAATQGILLVVCAGIAFYCILQNLGSVGLAVGQILSMLSPFLLGSAMAFILNVPMRAIERGIFRGAAGRSAALCPFC